MQYPLKGVRPDLVLDAYSVTDDQRWESFGMLCPPLCISHVAVPKCLFPGLQRFTPSIMGWYLPGGMGIKSLMARPKMHIAGESLVSLSGVFRYCSMARWKVSVSRSSFEAVLSMSSRFTVLTPTSARQCAVWVSY